jgi:hypothetical protein
MTEQNPEEYEDVFPLMGAIGPYLSFTTPIEDDESLPENTPDNTEWPDDLDDYADADFWEEDEL